MIKLSLRHNLIYPFYLIIWTLLRKVISVLISKLFEFNGSVVFTFLMFLGEILRGILFYQYQNGFCEKKIKNIFIMFQKKTFFTNMNSGNEKKRWSN